MSRHRYDTAVPLHSVGPFSKRICNHFLVVITPPLHHRLRVRIHHRIDVVDDILPLSALLVKGDTVTCQRCKGSSDIELRTARDAYVKTRQAKVHEQLDKGKELFTRRWDSGPVRTLVERVQDNINGRQIWDCEHVNETLYHCTIAGLLCTIFMNRIKRGKDVATRTRLRRKLDEERWEEIAAVLFIDVPKIEIKVRHQG